MAGTLRYALGCHFDLVLLERRGRGRVAALVKVLLVSLPERRRAVVVFWSLRFRRRHDELMDVAIH